MGRTRSTKFLLLFCSVFLATGCITSINPSPADPEGTIHILGSGFGSSQADGFVSFTQGDQVIEVHEVVSWSSGEIVLDLPAEVGTSYVCVHADYPLFGFAVSDPFHLQVKAAGLPSAPYGYEVPVQDDSPWPSFRRTRRNTGRSPIAAAYPEGTAYAEPWSFETGKGIFSTPILGGDGTVYVGSADHNFYAINPEDGSERWRYQTGELIDSAATITRFDEELGYSKVVFLSGDGNIYCLRTGDGLTQEERLLWTFEATLDPGPGYNNWWEGNVVMGFDGTLYAGNTNWNYYAFTQEGDPVWTYTTGSNAWSAASFADDGTVYWGSLDTFIHAVNPDGTNRWKTMTLGFVSSSAAIGSDGTVYIGSFDSTMYALDPDTGRVKWQFPTTDHIYCSPALGVDGEGNTNAIYFGSADGTLYALNTLGDLLWTYDAGDTIRSSPVLGPAPVEEARDIVYFGCGNGKLFALNSDTGERRWSFDTTPDNPELKDRNDLNGSPALGLHGVHIAGEHGYVWYMPYDYCLHNAHEDCETDPGEAFEDDIVEMYYMTTGGTTELEGPPETIPAAAIITSRLVVREEGDTVDAAVCTNPRACPSEALDIDIWPELPFKAEPSADGHFVHIVPDGFMDPGTTYHFLMDGAYLTGGLRIGNLVIGGKKAGNFSGYMELTAQTSEVDRIPLSVEADHVTALEWKRLAAPLPPMMPSLNQIGFDSYHWILGTLDVSLPNDQDEGQFLMWAVGGFFNDEGVLVPDPATDFIFPLNGRYRNDFFILSNSNFLMEVTEVPVTFDTFELRGQLADTLIVEPGAAAYAEADCLSIPTFGPLMALAGLCNNVADKLISVGTFITRPYSEAGTANRRPEGISVSSLNYAAPTDVDPGALTATFALEPGATYPVAEHLAGLVLVDTETLKAVNIDYKANLSSEPDPAGNLAQVSLVIPAGTDVPATTRAIVVLDVFPFLQEPLPAK